MTAAWDSLAPPPARPRRIRGGEIPPPSPISWRAQRRNARQAALAAQARLRGGPASVEPEVVLQFGRLKLDADALVAFGLFIPLLFITELGTLGAAMIAGLTPLYVFMRRTRLVAVLAPRAFLFAFPLLAVFSMVWSDAPRESLKQALEFGVTITAGLLLSSARNQSAVLRAIALAFLIYVLKALMAGGQVVVGGAAGGAAFSGLTQSKNLMADIAATGLILSAAAAMISVRERRWPWAALFGAAAVIDLQVVAAARSAGAFVGLAMGLTPLLVLAPLVGAARATRAALTSTVAVALVIVGLYHRPIAQGMIDIAANVFHKDPTLTGRTYLWYRAADLIQERPILGRGYFAFWLQGNTDAEGMWRYAGIGGRGGFSFHNTLVDILVTLGWVGVLVFLATLLIGAVALVRRFVQRPSLALVFWLSICLYVVSRMPIETLAIQPFYFPTVLMFAALGAGFGRLGQQQTAPAAYRASVPVRVRPIDYAGEAWANPRLAPVRGSLRLLRKPDEAAADRPA